MAKLPPIRITKRDKQEYQRLRKNTQAKIRRTRKNYGIDLSDQVDLPPLSNFKTRKQFNEWKEQQESFTNRANTQYQFVKNEYGVATSKRDIYRITQDTKQAQRIAQRKIDDNKDKPVFHKGEKVGTVEERARHMKDPDVLGVHVPKDFDFSKVRNKRRLDDIRDSMKKRSNEEFYDQRLVDMKNNYIKMLEKAFNSEADDLIKEIKDIAPDDFYGLFLANFSVFDFNIYYVNDEDVEITRGQVEDMMLPIKEFKKSDFYN